MSEQSDKRRSIQEELAKLHSIEEMRRNIDAIIAKTGASKSLVYLEINRQETTREAVVKTLFDLFVVRSDTYAMQMEDKSYVRIDRPLTIDILKEHLEGKMTIGGYQLDRENMVKWLCFDIDPTCIENPKEIARLIYQKCVENNRFPVKSVVLEASRHPDPSYHIWVFFGNPIPAFVAKFFGERILVFCGNPKVELFPKQTKLEKDGYGNLVKLPLGLHRQTKKMELLIKS